MSKIMRNWLIAGGSFLLFLILIIYLALQGGKKQIEEEQNLLSNISNNEKECVKIIKNKLGNKFSVIKEIDESEAKEVEFVVGKIQFGGEDSEFSCVKEKGGEFFQILLGGEVIDL